MSSILDTAIVAMQDVVTVISSGGSFGLQRARPQVILDLARVTKNCLLADYTVAALLPTDGTLLGGTVSAAVNTLQILLLAMQDQAGLFQMNGYAQRISTNLSNAGG